LEVNINTYNPEFISNIEIYLQKKQTMGIRKMIGKRGIKYMILRREKGKKVYLKFEKYTSENELIEQIIVLRLSCIGKQQHI